MKRYIRSNRETHEGEFNYHYGGLRPNSSSRVEILGKAIGNLDVFQVWIDGNDLGYWWGTAPRGNNINLFGENAFNITKTLGVQVSSSDSDEHIIKKVNDVWKAVIEDPRSKGWFDYFDVDPYTADWEVVVARDVIINEPRRWAFESSHYVSKPSDLSKLWFCPIDLIVRPLVESGELQESGMHLYLADQYIKRISGDIRKQKNEASKIKNLRQTPYPYDASEELATAIWQLEKFIIRQHCGYAETLQDAEDHVRSKTVDYSRSSRYNDPEVDQQITELFDWAAENNFSVNQLISVCKDIVKLRKAKDQNHYEYMKRLNPYIE